MYIASSPRHRTPTFRETRSLQSRASNKQNGTFVFTLTCARMFLFAWNWVVLLAKFAFTNLITGALQKPCLYILRLAVEGNAYLIPSLPIYCVVYLILYKLWVMNKCVHLFFILNLDRYRFDAGLHCRCFIKMWTYHYSTLCFSFEDFLLLVYWILYY